MTLRQAGGHAGFEPVGLRRTVTMRDDIIGIALEGDGRICSLPPGIERLMEEEMREDRADTPPLRDPLPPLDEGPLLPLHRGLEPPYSIQEDPGTGRVFPERPHQQRMIKVVEKAFDVAIQPPVRAPASLPGHAQGLMRRLARSVALGVRVQHGLEHRFQSHGDPRLRHPIRHGWHASKPLTTVRRGDGYRPHRRRKITPGRQAIPELREGIGEMPLAVGERFLIDARRALMRLHPFRGFPHHPVGHTERLCCLHWCLPFLVDQHES